MFPPIVQAIQADALSYLDKRALADLHRLAQKCETNHMEGIFIEVGCALGGSAIVLASAKKKSRPLLVYDVFGMIPPPSEHDGEKVHKRYKEIRTGNSKGLGTNRYYGYEPNLLDRVRENFNRHGLSAEENNVQFIQGLFQHTLHLIDKVTIAHIDGDWYESIKICLERIEPHLIPGGTLVIDDYYHWSGCRKAVDEFFRDKRDTYDYVNHARLHIVKKTDSRSKTNLPHAIAET